MQDEMFDVVIVGYGPVGQMAAILLGQKGYRVSVFERWPQIYALPRAVHYDDEIARIFQAAGVTDQLLEVTEAVPDFYEWRNKAGEALLRLDWSGRGISGWPVANFFAQPELQAVLDKRARALPTVKVNQGWEVQRIAEHGDYVEVTAEQGHASQAGEWVPEESIRTVRARYLIGADGANSAVRQHMGTSVTDLGFAFDWLILDIIPHEQRPWRPMNWQLCDPVRPTTIVSGGPSRRRWEFMRLQLHDTGAVLESIRRLWGAVFTRTCDFRGGRLVYCRGIACAYWCSAVPRGSIDRSVDCAPKCQPASSPIRRSAWIGQST